MRFKSCVKLGENSAEASEILKTAFGNECLSRARMFEWFKKFKEGRNSINVDPRPRRPSTCINDDSVPLARIRTHKRLTVRAISAEVGISYLYVTSHFHKASEHAKHFCEIRSSCSQHQAEGTPLVCRH